MRMVILRSNSEELKDLFLESISSDQAGRDLLPLSELQIVSDRTDPSIYIVTLRFLPDMFIELSFASEELPALFKWCCRTLVDNC